MGNLLDLAGKLASESEKAKNNIESEVANATKKLKNSLLKSYRENLIFIESDLKQTHQKIRRTLSLTLFLAIIPSVALVLILWGVSALQISQIVKHQSGQTVICERTFRSPINGMISCEPKRSK